MNTAHVSPGEPSGSPVPAGLTHAKGDIPVKTKHPILVADDDEHICNLLSDLLSPYFEVTKAIDGKQAQSLIDTETFLFVILDIHLPHCSGLDLCEGISQKEAGSRPNIVILSGDDSDDTIGKAYSFGVDDYLLKPINASAFIERMRRLERDIIEKRSMRNKQDKTLSLADASMQQAAQYGSAFELIARLNLVTDLNGLAKAVSEFLKDGGFYSAVQVRAGEECVSYDIDSEVCSDVELKVFTVLRDKGRIYSFGKRTIFNDEHVSILVKNMPAPDTTEYGFLVDIAAKLVPAIDYKVIAIANQQAINQAVDVLSGAMDMIKAGIQGIALEKREAVEKIVADINISFHHLELTDEQEAFFVKMIEERLSDTKISDDFVTVNQTLTDCLDTIRSAQEMSKQAEQVEAKETSDDYQSVEFF